MRAYTKKLSALIGSIVPGGRDQVRALIQSVVDAGGVSEAALVDLVRAPGLDAALRANIAWLLPRLEMRAASGELRDELRADAAESLANVEDNAVVPALVEALADRSPVVRYAAAYALGEQGDPAAIPALAVLAVGDDDDTPFGRVSVCARGDRGDRTSRTIKKCR